jgi:hypothetical protein
MNEEDQEIFKYLATISILVTIYILLLFYYICRTINHSNEIELASVISSEEV